MNPYIKGNLVLFISRFINGVNSNAVKFLLPVWIGAYTFQTIRFIFAAIVFYIISLFVRHEPRIGLRDKIYIFLVGAIGICAGRTAFVVGLQYTTPVTSRFIFCLVPIWVFFLSMIFFTEKFTRNKGIGLVLGFIGVIISLFFHQPPEMATNPVLGNVLTLICSIINAFNLILTRHFLKKTGVYTFNKWCFQGAAFSACIISLFTKWEAPLFHEPLHWFPIAVFAFILIFPTVITYILGNIGLQLMTPTIVSLYGYLGIIITTVIAVIARQDQFQWLMVVSFIFLVFGLYFVEKGSKRDLKNQQDEVAKHPA